MGRVIKAPEPFPPDVVHRDVFTVFLAGSIEMGKARNWQEIVTEYLLSYRIVVLNPRRDDWDSSWVQSVHNPQFREQVEWELRAMELAHVIAMHFEPDTKSPITLLEFGLWARSGKLVVHCPEGFWRKGNVDVVSCMYGVHRVDSLEELKYAITDRYSTWLNQKKRFCSQPI